MLSNNNKRKINHMAQDVRHWMMPYELRTSFRVHNVKITKMSPIPRMYDVVLKYDSTHQHFVISIEDAYLHIKSINIVLAKSLGYLIYGYHWTPTTDSINDKNGWFDTVSHMNHPLIKFDADGRIYHNDLARLYHWVMDKDRYYYIDEIARIFAMDFLLPDSLLRHFYIVHRYCDSQYEFNLVRDFIVYHYDLHRSFVDDRLAMYIQTELPKINQKIHAKRKTASKLVSK